MSTTAVPRNIAGRGDIGFFRRAFADKVLGPIVVELARVDLFAHLPVMGDSTRIAGSIRRRLHGGHAEFVTIEPRPHRQERL